MAGMKRMASTLEFDEEKAHITGTGVKYTAREKDFIYHLHGNLQTIWNAPAEEKPQSFIAYFKSATGLSYDTWLKQLPRNLFPAPAKRRRKV